ncbi:MAG: fatty acid desaturase [Leptolyngbya sp.]|nr:fatty acid desaturase [Candidatus Melainabacteria bacterium]
MGIFNDPVVATTLAIIGWAVFWHHWHGLGITLGYHRLLTHKSLVVPKWLEYYICSGAYFALMGSPIVWVGVHRQHHQKSDQPGDPHSPRDGFAHALYKWMTYTDKVQTDEELRRQAADLLDDPLYKHLGSTHTGYHAHLCLALCVVFRIVLFFAFGWACVVGNLIATFTIFWSTQFVNAFCHEPNIGYRTYRTPEDSRNVWWVGLLALGEGWHNNHHAVPKSARHGLQWWEFDFTWMTIVLFERMGLAKRIVRPSKELLEKKRIRVLDGAQEKVANAVEAAREAAGAAGVAAREAAEIATNAAREAGQVARDAAETVIKAPSPEGV